MNSIEKIDIINIYKPIQKSLNTVDEKLVNLPVNQHPTLAKPLQHISNSSGKRMRAAITLLSAQTEKPLTIESISMAVAIELFHLASLIHDDAIDKSAVRRGEETISNLYGTDMAILIGDLVFANSASTVCDTGNILAIQRFSETTMEVSTGQILETSQKFNTKQNIEGYLERIYKKTASVFETSAETGGIISGATKEKIALLKSYGYNLGMAFQIIDDILDFEGDPNEFGKPVGQDLDQGLLTLPSLLYLEKFPNETNISTLFSEGDSQKYKPKIVESILNSEIIEECYIKAQNYCNTSKEMLEKLPNSEEKTSLSLLLDYVIERRQ
ncbi:MAG: polyprenyl synthetase family protein [Dehalococcoidia bacterium]|nr:polyprenyl synthetase family protein [Dehalococcoidia bacterium]|tara:strand:- start:2555 stop:3538 length:984 start_codon:yes stop_codon:yes gene_type:complete